MAAFTYELPGYSEGDWTGAIRVASTLVDGGAEAYLRLIDLVGISIRLQFSTTADGAPGSAGPALSDEWSIYASAIEFVASGGQSVTLKGPANPDNAFSDSSEPYFWTPDNSADLVSFAFGATGTVSITLDDGIPSVEGAGAAIEAHGNLGEAEGMAFAPVAGDGAPIEGRGALGEATGQSPVPGAGDGLRAVGSLGEAEGSAYPPVEAEGDSLWGEGTLGEAEGEALDVVRGEGAPIDGEGTLGEAEGEALGPIEGAGDGLRGEGSLGNAEGRSALQEVNLRLYANFTGSVDGAPSDAAWEDLTGVVSTHGLTLDCISGTQADRYAPDVLRVRLRQSKDPALVRRIRKVRRLGALLVMHGEVVWRGFILSGKAQRVDDFPDDLQVEGVDHAERLRVPCRSVDERDSTVLEIVETLISSVPGVVTDSSSDVVHMEPDVDATRLETMVEYFARKPGDATVLELIDGLLWQYGFTLYARPNGMFGIRSWWYSAAEWTAARTPAPRLVTGVLMQTGLRSEHRETTDESVAVQWSVVTEQADALLYRESLPIDSDGAHTGVIVLGDTFYPARGAVDAVWQSYRADWLVGAAGRGQEVDLLYATNQAVLVDADADISVVAEVHEPLRSRVVLENTGSDDTRRLRILDIRGDAVFRSQTRVTVVTTIPAVATTISDAVSPTVLRLTQTAGDDVDTTDGAYVGWTAVVRGIEAVISAFDGSDLEITLAAEPDGWAVADADEIVLRPPANGNTLDVSAGAIFDATAARRLAVALKDGILQAESFQFTARYDATPILGDAALRVGQFVRLTYVEWELDELVCVVRQRREIIGGTPGGTPDQVELEIAPVVELDETAGFPGPTLAAAGINVLQGVPGRTVEEVFAVTADDHDGSLPAGMRPLNDWGAREPGTAGGLEWAVGLAGVGEAAPIGWKATRGVSGYPSAGAEVADDWAAPAIVARYGEDGSDGDDGLPGLPGARGVPGDRGSTFIAREVSSGNTWASAGATVDGTDYSGGDDIASALAGFGGGPQPNDYVTLYRGAFTETRVWDGAAWVTVDAFLHGNLVVEGSIVGSRLAADTITAREIAANTITAEQIAARTIVAELIAAGTITANEIDARTITALQIAAETITANEIAANTITAGLIAAGTITANEIGAAVLNTLLAGIGNETSRVQIDQNGLALQYRENVGVPWSTRGIIRAGTDHRGGENVTFDGDVDALGDWDFVEQADFFKGIGIGKPDASLFRLEATLAAVTLNASLNLEGRLDPDGGVRHQANMHTASNRSNRQWQTFLAPADSSAVLHGGFGNSVGQDRIVSRVSVNTVYAYSADGNNIHSTTASNSNAVFSSECSVAW